MPDIKDDAMSLRNGPVVECLGPDDSKERIGIRACFGNAFKELMTKLNLLLGYRHVRMAPLMRSCPRKNALRMMLMPDKRLRLLTLFWRQRGRGPEPGPGKWERPYLPSPQ